MLKLLLCWFWKVLSPQTEDCVACHKVEPLCACCEMDSLCETFLEDRSPLPSFDMEKRGIPSTNSEFR